MPARHFRAQRLVAIVDRKRVQLDGFVKDVMDVGPALDKWCAFGRQTLETDGHDVGQLVEAIDKAEEMSQSGPVVIIAHTIKGKGVSYMENESDLHGVAPNQGHLRVALDEFPSADRPWHHV